MCEDILERPSSPTLDVYLAEKAVNEKKTIRPLESADEQCHPVPSVSKDEVSVWITAKNTAIKICKFKKTP